jgi:NAD(P)-dependent dehydrogenase (short-subunit alcohol dehydrogenase family)
MSLDGHIVLIAGAGQGIHRAYVLVFASKGADLVLLDKNPESLDNVTHEAASVIAFLASDKGC